MRTHNIPVCIERQYKNNQNYFKTKFHVLLLNNNLCTFYGQIFVMGLAVGPQSSFSLANKFMFLCVCIKDLIKIYSMNMPLNTIEQKTDLFGQTGLCIDLLYFAKSKVPLKTLN